MNKGNSEEYPHDVRIVRSVDYRKLYDSGKKVHSSTFVLFVRKNEVGHHRLGITVSRKTGNSVTRNRIKRLFREIFRKCFREIPGQFDILVNARPICASANYPRLREEFLIALQKVCQLK